MATASRRCLCEPGGEVRLNICYWVICIWGCLDSFSFWLHQCWSLPVKQLGVFPLFAPCLEHICAGRGGGGSVAIEGFVVYIGGDISCTLNAMLLVQYVSRRVAM